MGVVAHTPEAVQERQRVDRCGDVPLVVKVLTDAGGERKLRGDVPGDERGAATKERAVTVAILVGTEPPECGFDPDVQQGCDPGTFAARQHVVASTSVVTVEA